MRFRAAVERVVPVVLIAASSLFVLALAGVGAELYTEPPPAVNPYASAGGPPANRFVLQAVTFGESASVTITNVGNVAGSLEGYWLCNRPNYMPVPATVLQPGESASLSATDLRIDPADGEVGLYASNRFDDAAEIRSYVEWGAAGHGRSALAVAAGIWDGAGVAPGPAGLRAKTAVPSASTDWEGD